MHQMMYVTFCFTYNYTVFTGHVVIYFTGHVSNFTVWTLIVANIFPYDQRSFTLI